MIPEAVRWYKASGAQNYHDAACIFDCRKYGMPKYIGEYCKYYMGWDYCAAQLERLGHVGDAYEIYRLHLGQEGERVAGAFLLALLPISFSFHPLFFFRPECLGSPVFVMFSRASIKLYLQ
jgi:hypothetical protein